MFYGAIEGTGFEVLDPRFNECLTGHGRVERLWTGRAGQKGQPGLQRGAIWSGPTFRTTACCVTMKPMARFRFSATPSNNSNGNTVDREGRLVIMRTPGAARDPHGAQWLDHDYCRQL